MKKLLKLTALAASLVTFVALAIVGCADVSSDSENATIASGYTAKLTSANSIALTVNVNAESDLVDFSKSVETSDTSRDIAPVALDSDKVSFYLAATDLVDSTNVKPLQKVVFKGKNIGSDDSPTYSKTDGTVVIDLEPSNYRFTLVALLNSVDTSGSQPVYTPPATPATLAAAIQTAALIGYANADLRYANEAASINFVLSSDGLAGAGTLELNLWLKDWTKEGIGLKQSSANDAKTVVGNVTVGLYNTFNEAALANSVVDGINLGQYAWKSGTTTAPAGSGDDFGTYNGSDEKVGESTATYSYQGSTATLNAGTYIFKVSFTTNLGQEDQETYVWSENVTILPGQKTSKNIGIGPLFTLPPEAPEEFYVGYNSDNIAKDADYYKAVFNWKDKSNVEQFYEIQLFDVSSKSTVTQAGDDTNAGDKFTDSDNTKWTYANCAANWGGDSIEPTEDNGITSYSTEFYGLTKDNGPTWFAGSLQKNNQQAVFYLELGKRYLARIRAVNAVGKSAWVYSKHNSLEGIAEGATTPAKNATIKYTYGTNEITREATTIESGTSLTAKLFNTTIINLYRIKYEPNEGTWTPTNQTNIFYFDQTTKGSIILIPDGKDHTTAAEGDSDDVKAVKAAYKAAYGTASIALVKGVQPWTLWKAGSTTGTTYPNSYALTNDTTPQAGKTYYTVSDVNDADVSGSKKKYTAYTGTPASITANTYYEDLGTPVNYLGYSNLTLYASFTKTTFNVKLTSKVDYTLEKNINLTVGKSSGTGTTPFDTAKTLAAYDTVTVNRSGSGYTLTALDFVYAYKTGVTLKYDKVVLVLADTAGHEVGTYTTSGEGKTFTVNIKSIPTDTYKATLKGYLSNNTKKSYDFPVYLTITD